MTAVKVGEITELQQSNTKRWQHEKIEPQAEGLLQLVELNHSYNFQLWYEEDKARRDDMGFEYVYHAKRNIDRFNQLRNNMIESMDEWFYANLKPAPATSVAVSSETPGMIIDRLSILALKRYHMHKQTERQDVSDKHRGECQQKFNTIEQQLQQVSSCLSDLLGQVVDGTRTFRLYHQFKMYNDPTLNPQLYENA